MATAGLPYGLQAMLKEGHRHYAGLEGAVYRNIEACKALAAIVKTSMGPNGESLWVEEGRGGGLGARGERSSRSPPPPLTSVAPRPAAPPRLPSPPAALSLSSWCLHVCSCKLAEGGRSREDVWGGLWEDRRTTRSRENTCLVPHAPTHPTTPTPPPHSHQA